MQVLLDFQHLETLLELENGVLNEWSQYYRDSEDLEPHCSQTWMDEGETMQL